MRTGLRRAWCVTIGALSVVALSIGFSPAGAATRATTAKVVSSTDDAKLGRILVAGTTVYTLKPSSTGCTAACMREWPPVLLPHGVKKPTAGTGVDATKLGTVKLAKQGLQITYAGKRLYWSAKDKKAGQVHGNVTNKFGKWSTVAATTAAAASTTTGAPTTAPSTETSPPTTHPTSTTSGGNGGIGF
jgi:predicted lipoprotein with Yx(FWY)xxD motif